MRRTRLALQVVQSRLAQAHSLQLPAHACCLMPVALAKCAVNHLNRLFQP